MQQTILAIDDQPANLRLLEAFLLPEGYRVASARDAASALEACRRERPHLVLLDLLMPRVDGFAVLRALKQSAPGVPVVIVTALAARESKLRALELGASDFLAKPLDRAELLLRVRNLLQAGSLAAQLARKAAHEAYQRALRQEIEARQASIARELHDGVGGSLAAANLLLGTVRNLATGEHERALAGKAIEQLEQAAERIRQIARGIVPSELDPADLLHALEHLADDIAQAGDVRCTVAVRADPSRVSPPSAAHLYRIVQEATNNALRHGGATRIRILLAQAGDLLRLTVADNGRGCDPGAAELSPGLGIRSMQARADEMAGRFRIAALPSGGCKVQVCWPPAP